MIAWLYEQLTGQPYYTTRSASAEFGPPPAARYAAELARYSDAELIQHGPQILAALVRRDAAERVPAASATR